MALKQQKRLNIKHFYFHRPRRSSARKPSTGEAIDVFSPQFHVSVEPCDVRDGPGDPG
mgnify:CR=1 FL=1